MKKKKIIIILLLVFAMLCGAGSTGLRYFHYDVKMQPEKFTESAEKIKNPNRGFYYIYRFQIGENPEDYTKELADEMEEDTETTLSMAEINLQGYRTGSLSDAALFNIRNLFLAMKETDRKWIVRFLYDWDGQNQKKEPDNIEVIIGHMEQLGSILKENKDCIFTMQGLFIGNWGEMHGTKFADTASMKKLAAKLAESTDSSTYLAVRTPVQWRQITGLLDPAKAKSGLSKRLGLFNDGMLADKSDCGTYGEKSKKKAGKNAAWTRKEELAFQNKLCLNVPNGGEVITDNPYNDIEAAISDMKTMHVTYINEDYDPAVIEKWAASTVHTSDCFDGMDGKNYIERHLGYRLLLSNVKMSHNFGKDTVKVSLSFRNEGFAPLYRSCNGTVIIKDETGNTIMKKKLNADFTKLEGGSKSGQTLTASFTFSLRKREESTYSMYFSMTDQQDGTPIILANNEKMTENGYRIGTVTIGK